MGTPITKKQAMELARLIMENAERERLRAQQIVENAVDAEIARLQEHVDLLQTQTDRLANENRRLRAERGATARYEGQGNLDRYVAYPTEPPYPRLVTNGSGVEAGSDHRPDRTVNDPYSLKYEPNRKDSDAPDRDNSGENK